MKDDCKIGEDSLKLYFRIDESNLYIKCQDKNREDLGEFNLGNIFKLKLFEENTLFIINLVKT